MKKINHSHHQTDLPLELQILNISVNIARIGRKIEEGDLSRSNMEFIEKILRQTQSYLSDLSSQNISNGFRVTLEKFKHDLNRFKKESVSKENYLYWSEKALTWADILQIRAKLA